MPKITYNIVVFRNPSIFEKPGEILDKYEPVEVRTGSLSLLIF